MGIEHLSKENFNTVIATETRPVIVDFYADWCGPCKMVAPVLEQLATEQKDVSFYKVNVDENPEIASQFSVMNLPTFIAFKGGKHHRSVVGAQPKQAILDILK